MTCDDINMKNRTAMLRDTKNGEDMIISLSDKALQIPVPVPRNLYGRVFPTTRDN